MTILLVNNEADYYAFYLQSIFEDSFANYYPILSRHDTHTKQHLRTLELPFAENPPNYDERYSKYALRISKFTESENYNELMSFYQDLIKDEAIRKGSYIVGVGTSAGLGAIRAVYEKREFIAVGSLRDKVLSDLIHTANSIYFVVENLTDDDAAYIISLFQGETNNELLEGVPGVPVGFLHGRTFESMTFLDAKQRYFSKKDERLPHLIVDAFLSKAPDEAIEDVIAKPYAELNRNAVAEMGPLHILSVTSHGMSDLIHLNSDYICGKSPYLGIEPYINPHRLPSCMDHNGFCFFKKTGDALKAFEIKAKHVFVNSCGSLQFKQATFDPLFNVGYSFLEGHACSFVGALRWKDGYGSESVLFYQLLKNGYTLGEAVAILNDTLYSNQFEHSKNVFCLIGDPESALLQSEKAEYDTAHYDDKSKAIHLKFNAGFAHVKVESRLFVDVFMRQRMLLHVKALKETYFISAVPTKEKNALHLFVYSNGNIHGDQLLNIEDVSALFDNLLYVYRNVDQNLNNTLGLNKLYPNWIKQGGKKNIENRLLNVSRLLKECFIHHHQFPKFRKSSHMFFQEVDKLNFDIAKTLYESISRTSFRFSEYYQESFVLQPDHSPEDCYLCGKTLASRTLVHILQPNIKRTETICSSCGGLEDKPDHDLSLQLKLQESFTKASNNNVVLQLKNSTEKVFDGYCVLAVRRSSELGIGSGEPIKKILLQPHETKEVDFELVVESDVPIHQYALQTAFISMTQIYLSGRSIWVH